MDAKILFNKILDLAIRGRLTEQLESDGSAQDLIDQIENEKKREIEEYNKANPKKAQKKYVAPKPIPSEDYPFEIPGNWKWVRLGEVFDVRDGTHDTPQYVEKGYPLITSKDFNGNNFDFSKTKYISENDYLEISKRSKVEVGDILYSMIGGNIGSQISITNENYFPMAIKNVALFKPLYLNLMDNSFLSYYLKATISWYKGQSIGGAQPFIGLYFIRNQRFPLPPLSEQKRIVAKLEEIKSKIDKYIENEEAINNDCDILRNKVLDLAIKGGLTEQLESDGSAQDLIDQIENEKKREIEEYNKANPKKTQKKYVAPKPIPSEDIPFEIPKNWKWVRLGEICDYGKCNSVAVDNIKEDSWILELEDIEKGTAKINQYLMKKQRDINGVRHSFCKGDLLYSKLRTYLNKVLVAPMDGYCTTEIIPIKSQVDNSYLCIVMRSDYFIRYTQTCDRGVKMPRLTTEDGKRALVPLPPLSEQKRIVSKLEEIFGKIDKIKNGIPKSEKVFKFPETEGQKMPVAAEGGTQFSGKG